MPQQPAQPQTPNVAGFITASRAKGISDTDIYSYLSQKGLIGQQKAAPAPKPTGAFGGTPTASFGGKPSNTPDNPVADFAGGVKDAAVGGINHAIEGENEASSAKNPVDLLEGSAKIAGGAAQAVTSPIAPLFKPVGDAVNAAGKALSNTPLMQAYGKDTASLPANQPTAPERILGTVNDLTNVAATVAGGKEGAETAPKVVDTAIDAAKTGADKVKTTVANAKDSLTPKPEQVAAKQQAKSVASQAKAKDAIDTEIRNTASKYPAVGKVLNESEATKGNDPISVLASYDKGKALPTMVKGKLQTDAATNFLKSQVSKLGAVKSDLNFLNDNKISLNDFAQRAKDTVDAQTGWSAAKKADAKAQVGKIFDAMKPNYKEDLPMAEVDKLKTEHTQESTSYNSKSPFSLDAHGIVGKAARDIVSMHADGAPIDELNKLMSSHYDAIKLLQSMRGKTPHGGLFSKHVGQVGGEVIGAAAGATLGHPFLGAMAGRAGADFVNEVVNNHFISNPLKRTLITNMKGVDPEVMTKALAHIEDKSSTYDLTPTK